LARNIPLIFASFGRLNRIRMARWAFGLYCLLFTAAAAAQNGVVRGNVYDKDSGEPVLFSNVRLLGTELGDQSDINGFFTISNVPPGRYRLVASYVGYDSSYQEITVAPGEIAYQRLILTPAAIDLVIVDISGRRERARAEPQVARIIISPKEIRTLPAAGGQPDLAQYLPALPGVIFSGDQGGQLYIRGGTPVQNRFLLDGMTLYNPFHSIGLFSVFETEAIRSVESLSAGFNAEHGGRVSAVLDVKTREGNHKRFGGLLSASPFQARAMLEGPILPLKEEGGGSISFLLSGKRALINESSGALYSYARDERFLGFQADSGVAPLPYDHSDWYGKLTLVGDRGLKVNLFGFNFNDRVRYGGLFQSDWSAAGGGLDFMLIPAGANLTLRGVANYSNYAMTLREPDGRPRRSGVDSYTAGLFFTYYGAGNQLDYGFELSGFNTDFQFDNPVGITFGQRNFTTELAGYLKYRQKLGNLIVEPGLRLHYYASQPALSVEPRLNAMYLLRSNLRLKLGGGLYSQNLLSALSDLDVVNFFIGFLAGPEETIFRPDGEAARQRLQRAAHAVLGVEMDLGRDWEINVEAYHKHFPQLIELNRAKTIGREPNFVTETGDAYGLDISLRFERTRWYGWATYSLALARRDDGQQVYPTVFDRRHNVNLLGAYRFGARMSWEFALRWNYGAGFPFTQTQAFYHAIPFDDKLLTDILTGNYNLGLILAERRNGGRLPDYHRLDASLKKSFALGGGAKLEAVAAVANMYNRANIFYIDRSTNQRVNQLPILPSLGLTLFF
jgi:hypothetical protein